MIRLTRPDGTRLILNSEPIETIESTPHTVIHLTTQKYLLVKESPAQVVARVLRFRRTLARGTTASYARFGGC